MRTSLLGLGAVLLLAYPVVLLFAITRHIDQPPEKPAAAAIMLTPRSAHEWLERDAGPASRSVPRHATIRKSGN